MQDTVTNLSNNKADKMANIASITRSGTTFTAKNSSGAQLFTFDQQDNNTTTGTSYNAGSCPNNTTFGTNGSIARVYAACREMRQVWYTAASPSIFPNLNLWTYMNPVTGLSYGDGLASIGATSAWTRYVIATANYQMHHCISSAIDQYTGASYTIEADDKGYNVYLKVEGCVPSSGTWIRFSWTPWFYV